MTPEDKTEIASMIADALKPRPILGPDGLPVLPPPPPPPRVPFDWNKMWTDVAPWLARIATIILITYFGDAVYKKADSASNHAEAAAVQSKENATEIKAAHKTVSRIVGAAVQE